MAPAAPVGGDPQAAAITAGEDPSAETLDDSLTTRYMPAGFTNGQPESGETIAERLGMIVAAAMGYEPEDLPWEVPLIELGLDSLMAVRIKNRVEYDFDLPPIQLKAVRDANLYAVEKLIEYAIEHRDEVEQLHEHQKTQTAEDIARAQAELLSGATPASVTAPAPDPQAEPETGTGNPGNAPAACLRYADSTAADGSLRPGRRPAVNGGQPNLKAERPKRSTRRRSPRRSTPTFRRVTPPSGSPSPPGRSSPASPRAASSTRCPSWTVTPPRRWRSGSPSAPRDRSPPRTC